MQRSANTDLKVGLTVIVGLIVLIGGIILAKGWRLDSKRIFVNASFPTASGIEPGDPVYIHGIKRGAVNQVTETKAGPIAISIELYEAQELHKDATALISMAELMGGKKMEIDPGHTGGFNVDRDTIYGASGGDLASLVTYANSLTGTVSNMANKIDTVLNSVNDLFGNGALKHKAYTVIDNASSAITELRSVLRENRAKISNTLTQVESLATNGNATLNELRPKINGLTDTVASFLHRSQFTLAKADSILNGLNTILTESRDNKSFFYKLTSDKEFSRRIDSTIQAASALLKQMRTQGLDVNIKVF